MATVTQIGKEAAPNYRGCGEAWAAFRKGHIVAIRYLDRGQANNRNASWSEHRQASLKELIALEPDALYRGDVSCWEFISRSFDLLPALRRHPESLIP